MLFSQLLASLLSHTELAALPPPGNSGRFPVLVSGLSAAPRAHFAAALAEKYRRPLVVLCPDESSAMSMAADLRGLLDVEPVLIDSREFNISDVDTASRPREFARIFGLHELQRGARVTIITAGGLLMRAMPPELLAGCAFSLKVGEKIAPEDVIDSLLRCGYRRSELIEGQGQFSRRGGILDIFSPAHSQPVRMEFWGDEIDSMGFFDTSTQRRIENTEYCEILPASETLTTLYKGGNSALAKAINAIADKKEKSAKTAEAETLVRTLRADAQMLENGIKINSADRYAAMIYGKLQTALDYLPEDCLLVMEQPGRFAERAREYQKQLSEDLEAASNSSRSIQKASELCMSPAEAYSALSGHSLYMTDAIKVGSYPINPTEEKFIVSKQLPPFMGNAAAAMADAKYYLNAGYRIVIICMEKRRAETLQRLFAEEGISAAVSEQPEKLPDYGRCLITVGGLSAGVEYPGIKLCILTDSMLLARRDTRTRQASTVRKTKKRDGGIDSFYDLAVGDIVVHNTHGIGRFAGVTQMSVDGAMREYVKICFAGTDVLYVPATAVDTVSKYLGGGDPSTLRLSKMGGAEWQNTKSRAKSAAKELARGLIALYAARMKIKGHACAPDTPWQTEFEDSFAYALTDDQEVCTREIKADMERDVPMDRLLCGDVGFGKTEVALRAVMKCILEGRQAAMLAPTTVLASQHYHTAISRFFGHGVNIEVLSRFRRPAEIKKTLQHLKTGECDFVIGTHRLLQKDIEFKDLGLLIVDEEHRFGVGHKEHIKEMSKGIDVLSLSATPIPRTLNMAMSGIRDLSTIDEPPEGRLPVTTYVMEHDWQTLADAMRKELSRGGQVYYLHNRISSIDRCAAKIGALLPDAIIRTAHGRMGEDQLARVMEDMTEGLAQILVCTTIIETGIDISNVNTLIIEDADKLGLAQLHQLRGRVGRSSRRASAYLTFRRDKVISEIAEKRLSAIREFAEFNSGIKIAMRDLEIRGAGNILGAEQSGHMLDVGYDMYMKLLQEAVLEERGEPAQRRADCAADLAVTAGIPEAYIPASDQRMSFYRRIALIRSEEDAENVFDELIDRYGEIPPQTVALIDVARLRISAGNAGITDISQRGGKLFFSVTDIDMALVTKLYGNSAFKGRLKVEAGASPKLSVKLLGGQKPLAEAEKFVAAWTSVKEPAVIQ